VINNSPVEDISVVRFFGQGLIRLLPLKIKLLDTYVLAVLLLDTLLSVITSVHNFVIANI